MKHTFGEALYAARKQKGLSQQQLADSIPVNRSSVANWEADRRWPGADVIAKIADVLGVEVKELLDAAGEEAANPVVMIVDDNRIILKGAGSVIEKTISGATVVAFTGPLQAIEYARNNRVDLAFLDIELGTASGIDLCKTLLGINPHMNVVFLTAYPEYAINAWNTDACGFMVKPITKEAVQAQLKKLRHPFPRGGNA